MGEMITVHEVRHVDQEAALACVPIGQHTGVWEAPTKRVGDHDNDRLGSLAVRGPRDVAVQSMDLGFCADGDTRVHKSRNTVLASRTRHADKERTQQSDVRVVDRF